MLQLCLCTEGVSERANPKILFPNLNHNDIYPEWGEKVESYTAALT